MPTIAATVTPPPCSTPCPPDGRHNTDVDDAHVDVRQLLRPRRLLGVASSTEKLSPDTVTLHPAVTTALKASAKLTKGAGAHAG